MKAVLVTICVIFGVAHGAPHVIGGDTVNAQHYPYLVSIQSGIYNNKHICGGAIISPTWVITAAHCAGISLIVSRIVAGTFNLSNIDDNPAVQIRNIDLYSVVKHPEYSGITNDIALLKMTEPFEFNEFVKPLQISKVSCYAMDEINVFSGWATEDDSDATKVSTLQTANMSIVLYQNCYNKMQSVYGNNLPLREDIHICVTGGAASLCILDGGGPLIQDNRLIGLLSWLPATCSGDTVPAIFTNSGYYKDFIKQYVTDLPSS